MQNWKSIERLLHTKIGYQRLNFKRNILKKYNLTTKINSVTDIGSDIAR